MPDPKQTGTSVANQIIGLPTDAVPDFIMELTANKTLSVTVAELNKLILFGERSEKETAVEALTRLGFIHPVANSDPA